MNSKTSEHNIPFGIRTSQLKSRNDLHPSASGFTSNYCPLDSQSVSSFEDTSFGARNVPMPENCSLPQHDIYNKNRKSVRGISRDYKSLLQNMKAKSLLTQQILCGPLNNARLTRKSGTKFGGVGVDSMSSSNNFHQLYGVQKQCPVSWSNQNIRQQQVTNGAQVPFDLNNFRSQSSSASINDDTSSASSAVVSNEHFSSLSVDNRGSQNGTCSSLQAGQVPDLVNVDYKEACPLYDSSEYEKDVNVAPLSQGGVSPASSSAGYSDEDKSEVQISRYAIFIGERLSQKFISSQHVERASKTRTNVPREEALAPLLTIPEGDDSFRIFEYQGHGET